MAEIELSRLKTTLAAAKNEAEQASSRLVRRPTCAVAPLRAPSPSLKQHAVAAHGR